MSKEEEQKSLFLAEALEQYERLNQLFTQLEKGHTDTDAIKAIFRITHTLKANAAALELEGIATLAHLLEDIFSLIKQGNAKITPTLFNDLFRANDKLGDLINNIKTQKRVPYKGMSTKLKVILRELKGEDFAVEEPATKPTNRTNESLLQDASTPSDAQNKEEAQNAEEEELEEAQEDQQKAPVIALSDYIQVPVKKLDQLMNLVGELVIERDRLMTESLGHSKGKHDFAPLYRISADLQYAVMSVRLVKVNILFGKFHRIVRDVANVEEKAVDLSLEGTEIEIDRNVLNTISESLIHLVRNAISHGIDKPSEREAAGKPPRGLVKLVGRNERDAVVIDVIDDGKGIDPTVLKKKAVEKGLLQPSQAQSISDKEALNLIFESGFSSKDQVTEVAGRGVGMDAVKQAIEGIGGEIRMDTQVGKGSTFSMVLPSSMAVKKALLFEVQGFTYALPLTFIDSVIQMKKEELHRVGQGLIAKHGDHTVSLIFLQDVFDEQSISVKRMQASLDRLKPKETFYAILLKIDGKWLGLGVDRLIQQQEIIEKPLSSEAQQSKFISGATILGDGSVCLVIDILAIARVLFSL